MSAIAAPNADIRCALPLAGVFRPEYLAYYRMLPLDRAGDVLRVAVAGTPNEEALEDLVMTYGSDVELVAVEPAVLDEAMRLAFADHGSMHDVVRDLDEMVEPGSGARDESLADGVLREFASARAHR